MKSYVSIVAALLLASTPALALDPEMIDLLNEKKALAEESVTFLKEFDCAGSSPGENGSCDSVKADVQKEFDELLQLIEVTRSEYTAGKIGDTDSRWHDIGDYSRIAFQGFESFKEDFNN